MRTSITKKTIIPLFVVLIFCNAQTLLGQKLPGKVSPWFPFDRTSNAIAPSEYSFSSSQSKPNAAHNVTEDTITFELVPANLRGVFTGDALWFDYDNDNDYDIIVAGWDDTNHITKIYNNDAGVYSDIDADIIGLATERGMSWADFDNDGDFDFAITGRTDTLALNPVSRIYKNDDSKFVDIEANLIPLNGGSVAWADYDRDGDEDLFLCGSPDRGSTFYSIIYRNDKDTFININAGLPGVWGSSVDWGDYDNDGDQDILLTGYGDLGQTVKVYRNDGNDLFTDANVLLPYINSGGAIWGDYDNDKDLDIAISGCIAGGALSKILRNDSLNVFTDIQANIKPLCISTLKWGDYDNDGDLDLAISGGEDFIHGTNPTTKIYRNDSGLFVDTDIRLQGTYFGSLNWGDYNNDGNIDLLMTGGTVSRPYYSYSGPFYPVTSIYKNNTQLRNIRPTAPASAAANVEENEITFSWDQANDNETPQHALTYNLRIGTMPGGTDIVAPSSNIFTGFRRLPKKGNSGYKNSWSLSNLPSGTYYWSVQAVDNEFAGSIFTDEQAVVVSSGVNTVSFSTNEGWNVVSVPLTVADYSAGTLFRSLGSQAFAYEGSYVVKDTLTNGSGYWLKFNTSGLINISGEFVSSQTIEVSEGWNLIGSISSPIDVTSITSVPGGLITSEFFEYNYGYSSSNTIEPGKGYWVRAETSGQLILSTSSSQSSNRIKIVSSSEQPPTPPNNTQPVQFRLDQNFPNPFNPSTNLQFHIGKAGFVSMKIYDMLGQEVANLVNEEKQPGDYSVVWDAKELPSGVYACKLISGESLSINKLLLIK